MSRLLDELTFGEWWLFPELLVRDYRVATDEERAHISNCVRAYDEVASSLGSRAANDARAILEELEFGSYLQDRPLPQVPRTTRTCPLSPDEIAHTIEQFRQVADATSADLEGLGRRLKAKWFENHPSVNRAVRRIAESLGISFGFAVLPVPIRLKQAVDFAMFPPLPPDCPPVMLLSRSHSNPSRVDPFSAARLLLAVAHEIAGHANDYQAVLACRDRDATLILDRELLEGWGITAEARLSALGRDEHSLHQLYRIKRLLPLVPVSMPPDEWAEVRRTLDAAWPGFFESSATAVLRRTTGVHARGLIRVDRLIRIHGADCIRDEGNPWQ